MLLDIESTPVFKSLMASVKARKTAVLVGDPGTGKTELMRSYAKNIGYELITLIGSQMDPTDITGLPKGETIPIGENGEFVEGTVYLAPWWQVEILTKKKVILFLDEFSNTSGAVRASMLTMLQNREFPNGKVMPPETIVVGAMNPADQAADGYQLDTPTSNRIFFIPWSPTAQSWKDGMLVAFGKEDVSENEMNWRRKVVGFIDDNPTWLHRMPEDVETTETYGVSQNDNAQQEILGLAWASRRSWDDLSKMLAHTDDDDHETQDLLANGTVGYGAANAFRDWLRKQSKIEPKKVIKDPSIVKWKTLSLDDGNLLLRAIMKIREDENTIEIQRQVISVFEKIAEEERTDLGGPYMLELIKSCSSFKFTGDDKKRIGDLATSYAKKDSKKTD